MSTTETESAGLSTLLNELEQFRDSNLHEIYIPSLDATGSFKQLTVRQQSSVITGILAQETKKDAFSYYRVISEIITENSCLDQDPLIIDRIPILLQLRINTLGSSIMIDDTSVDLSSVSFKLSGDEVSMLEEQSYMDNGITVTYAPPTINRDVSVNKFAEEKWSEITGEEILVDLFKIELCKYINSLSFEDKVIKFADLSIEERLQVCEHIPMSHSRKIVEYIEAQNSIAERFTQIEHEGQILTIPIDEALFSTGA